MSLSSGSNGNCYYLCNDSTAIVIDMGIGWRTLCKRLSDNSLSAKSIEMILVTHDHIDHIKHLGSVASRLSVPIFATSKLHSSFDHHPCTAGCISGCKRVIKEGLQTEHRGVKFIPFTVPHDATETLGYFIDFMGDKFVFMTDLGFFPDCAIDFCRCADHLIIESNYDTDMLIRGNYPPELKLRIMNGRGHLSNDQCASALKKVYHNGLKSVFLCHLSENNNTSTKAYNTAFNALSSINVNVDQDIHLSCLPRRDASQLFLL